MFENVYIVDDDAFFRTATTLLLRDLGYAPRPFALGADFLEELPYLAPGCVLMDLKMPGKGGLATVEEMGSDRRAAFPVVFLTGDGDVPSAVAAMRLGAVNFLQKPLSGNDLASVIGDCLAGSAERAAEAREHAGARSAIARLTAREHEVLRHMVAGGSSKTIARHLDLSVRTVEMHRSRLMKRLGVRSTSEAVRIAMTAGTSALEPTASEDAFLQ